MPTNFNYRSLCVTKQKHISIYPKTIPKERGPLTRCISISLCLFLFLVDFMTSSNPLLTNLMDYTTGIIFLIILQIIHRIILMCEELKHLTSRYDGSIYVLLEDTFNFRPHIWFTLFFCILYSVSYGFIRGPPFSEITIHKLVFMLTSIYLIEKVSKLSDGPLNNSLWIAENNGLDYGSGMAYSFFHGYLNLVLPETGRGDKNLKETIEDYESKNGVIFGDYKLFILIPKSMKCHVSLKNKFSPSIEESSSLEEKVITVAGVQNRIYKNAVYKIVLENGKRVYVAAEYATPLKTFKDVFDTTGIHSEYYNKLKKDIILQFYLTLRNVLEDKNMSQYCELIYFEDSYLDSEGETSYYDVGKIIQARLKELRKKRD